MRHDVLSDPFSIPLSRPQSLRPSETMPGDPRVRPEHHFLQAEKSLLALAALRDPSLDRVGQTKAGAAHRIMVHAHTRIRRRVVSVVLMELISHAHMTDIEPIPCGYL